MKNEILIGLSVLFLVILAGGVFVMQERAKAPIEQAQKNGIQKNNPAESEKDLIEGVYKLENIDTNDWQTYENDKYGFLLKYPKDWEVQKDSSSEGEQYLAIEFNQKNAKVVSEGLREGSIGIYVSTDKNKELVLTELKDLKKENSISALKVKVAGFDGYYISGYGEGLKMNTDKYYFSIMSSLTSEKTSFDGQVRATLNGMIQTLRFTN